MGEKMEKLLNLSPELEAKLVKAVRSYSGNSSVLESALGTLIVGQHYGWRVIKLIHNQTTYKKYEKVLGIKFQDLCEEETKISRKSVGYKIAKSLNSFWAVVRGKIPVENKTSFVEIEDK